MDKKPISQNYKFEDKSKEYFEQKHEQIKASYRKILSFITENIIPEMENLAYWAIMEYDKPRFPLPLAKNEKNITERIEDITNELKNFIVEIVDIPKGEQ